MKKKMNIELLKKITIWNMCFYSIPICYRFRFIFFHIIKFNETAVCFIWFISVKNRESNLDLYFKKKVCFGIPVKKKILIENLMRCEKLMWLKYAVFRMYVRCVYWINSCIIYVMWAFDPWEFEKCCIHHAEVVSAFESVFFVFVLFLAFYYYCRVFNRFYNLKFGI